MLDGLSLEMIDYEKPTKVGKLVALVKTRSTNPQATIGGVSTNQIVIADQPGVVPGDMEPAYPLPRPRLATRRDR